jgi:3-oxoacyl-[acyl-carrier protein] reductase
MQLKDQVVIVTGAGSGIGLAYARRLLIEGARVVLADVAPGKAESVVADHSDAAMYVKLDVRDEGQSKSLVQAAVNRFGKVDGLVNNAALFTDLKRKPFEELSAGDWERVLAVNVIGVFNCTKAAVSIMKPRNRGKIVNIASNVVHKGLPQLLHYVASKGAVIAMTRALARELGPFGINVNAIAPGYVMHERTQAADAGRNEQVVRLRSLARTQQPDDLCGTLVFLLSAASDFISGQTIVVDGGEVFA